eukprot:329563-Pleurochrysis_carterae.AAC.8
MATKLARNSSAAKDRMISNNLVRHSVTVTGDFGTLIESDDQISVKSLLLEFSSPKVVVAVKFLGAAGIALPRASANSRALLSANCCCRASCAYCSKTSKEVTPARGREIRTDRTLFCTTDDGVKLKGRSKV